MAKGFFRCYNNCFTKKNQAKKCNYHRTISLISYTGKIVARIRILSKRLESEIEEIVEADQSEFWKGKGTRDDIGLLRIILERVLDVKEEMCLCFIDWQKAFDHVNWTKLLEMHRNIGVNRRECQLIRNLYVGQIVKLCLDQGENDSIKIGRGVRQGCCMSPILFNLYGEYLMKEALAKVGDIKIG